MRDTDTRDMMESHTVRIQILSLLCTHGNMGRNRLAEIMGEGHISTQYNDLYLLKKHGYVAVQRGSDIHNPRERTEYRITVKGVNLLLVMRKMTECVLRP